MSHAQKPDFVFRRNGRDHLNQRGASVQSTTGSRGVRISGSNAGYTMFRGSVKGTDYTLHSPVSPSLPLPCVAVCHHISTGLYSEQHFCAVSTIRRRDCWQTVGIWKQNIWPEICLLHSPLSYVRILKNKPFPITHMEQREGHMRHPIPTTKMNL